MQQLLADVQQAMETERKMAAKEREKTERLEKAVETERKGAAEEKDRARRLEEKVNRLEKELTIAKEVMDDTTEWIVTGVRVLLPFLTSLLSLF